MTQQMQPGRSADLDATPLPAAGAPGRGGGVSGRSAPGGGTSPPRPVRRRRGGADATQWVAYLYLAPALVMFTAFVVVPLFRVVGFSFYEWNGVGPATWAGLANYGRMLGDAQLHEALLHSLVFIVFYSVLPVAIGLALAGLLGRREIRGMRFFRTVLFLPQVTTMVAVGVAWRWMYAEDGTVNQFLRLVGVGSADTAWLGDFTWALPMVGAVGTWVMFGFCMLLFLAGIGKIDNTLYDAVRVDGAGPVREFFTVTLPGLRHEVTVAVVVTMIAALRSFDLVFVTTSGGPGNATLVPGFLIYRLAFRAGDVGGAATVAVLLTLLIFAVVLLVSRVLRERP
jgi:raffinose/stachyose/melibiose transport system permease protein